MSVNKLEKQLMQSDLDNWESLLSDLIIAHIKENFGKRLSGFEKFRAQKLLDRLIGTEDTYGLKRFKKDVGAMSPEAIAARKKLYLNGAAQIVPMLDRANSEEPFERRILDERPGVQHCPECKKYADRGWVLSGSLPDIGTDCSCLTNCQCRFEYGTLSDTI